MIHRSDSELNLDLIVFEQRNKSYGAFELRRNYNSNVKNALFGMAGIITCLFLLYTFFPDRSKKMVDDLTIIDCDLNKEIDISTVIFETKPKVKQLIKSVPTVKRAPSRISKSNSFEISKDPLTPTTSTTSPLVATNSNPDQPLSTDTSAGAGDSAPMIAGDTDGEDKSGMDDRNSLTYADVMPVFPGGDKAMTAYVLKHLKFPFVDEHVSGKVFVQFTIALDGSVTNVQLMKGIHPQFDDEAMRVISKMPKWIPGKYHGRNVQVRKVIPIHFRVD